MTVQEYSNPPKRSTQNRPQSSQNRSRPVIHSSPDLSSRNSPKRRPFFVPPGPSRTRPELRSPVPSGDGRREAAERPTASADSLPGLSPRVRGNPVFGGCLLCLQRSIPACAGEPPDGVIQSISYMVYPRVCGGTP